MGDNPTQAEIEDIWATKGPGFAYRAARSGMEQTIKSALVQVAEVSEVGDISVFSNTGSSTISLHPNGKDLLLATYRILLEVEVRMGIHAVYCSSKIHAPPHKL